MKHSLGFLALLALLLSDGHAATFTVISAAAAGPGTLNQAILDANAHPGSDVIAFNLPGAGVHSIVTGGLPEITEAVSLDGTTQPGYGGLPLIELRADVDGFDPAAISISASGCAVRGLAISQTDGNGAAIQIKGPGGNTITGCFIGTSAAGTSLSTTPGEGSGIRIDNSPNNQIGGAESTGRNLISGNNIGIIVTGIQATGNRVQGNWIGVDVTGTNALPNSQGISINTGASTNRIGGTTAAARNIISGNLLNGMVVSGAHHNFIEGNFVGLDRTGQKPLGNGNDGVLLLGASFNTIGGVDVPAGNYISANGGNGIELAGSNGTSGISSSSNSVMGNFLGLPAPVGAGTALRSARLQRVESDGESWGPSRTTFLNGYQFRGNGVRLTFGDDNRIGSPNPLVGFNTIAMRNSPGISGLAGNGNIVLGGTFYGCGEAPLIRFEPGANRSVIRPSTSLTMVSVLNPQWLSFALNLTAEPNSTINCYCYGRFYLPMSDTGANRSWTMDTYVGDNFVTTDGTGVGPAFGTWPIGMTGLVVTTVDQHNDCSSTSPYSLVIPGSVSRDLWKLDLGYSTSSKSFHLSNPFAFYLQGKESLDKPWVNLSYGIDYQIRPEKSDYDYYRGVLGVTTGILSGTITGTTIGLKPADEIRLSGGAPSFRITTNTFALTNAPTGVVELTIEKRVETVDPTTGSTNNLRVEVPVMITNAAPGVPIVLKVEIAPVTAKPCKCSAWCGIVGATVDGVQTVVTAGGKFGNCPEDAVVTVTGPGGIELSLSNSADGRRARKSFSPAGNGVWTVTTTICGVSKTCTISLP